MRAAVPIKPVACQDVAFVLVVSNALKLMPYELMLSFTSDHCRSANSAA